MEFCEQTFCNDLLTTGCVYGDTDTQSNHKCTDLCIGYSSQNILSRYLSVSAQPFSDHGKWQERTGRRMAREGAHGAVNPNRHGHLVQRGAEAGCDGA